MSPLCPDFTGLHPYAADEFAQGNLQLMYEMQKYLSDIFGMAEFTLQPAAGAHGELTGVMMIKKYFEKKGEKRRLILIPDAAHGTNPASGALCGFDIGDAAFQQLKAALILNTWNL
ncbi:MAG: hypothetical protein MZU91_09920 [Desulfosudis oleivorans]|nr:hypothetical protein [Desulfosudis oleivorans]